jgi:hypothetical protein
MNAYHAVFEVRYKPAPRYLDTRGAILDEFKDRYPELQIEDLPIGPPLGALGSHVRLANSQRGIKTFVNGTHAAFEMEFEPFDFDAFAREAERFCRTVARDVLRVEVITRVGMRFWYQWENPVESLVEFMLHGLLRSNEDFSDMNLDAQLYQLRFTATDSDYGYIFQYYPQHSVEDEKVKLTGLLVGDFDVYKQNQPVSILTSARELVQDAQRRSLELGERLQKGIFSQ